jgi:hypothetical protein
MLFSFYSSGEFRSVITASEAKNVMVSIIRIAVSIIYFSPYCSTNSS